MPMCHKAYAFDWRAFERDELPGLLTHALETDDTAELLAYVERNRASLKDPYEGDPLSEDWRDMMDNRDIHECGDFALTRFYAPAADRGLGYCWNEIDDALPEKDREVLLGSSFGPPHNRFDPGRYGSYFQVPAQVAVSLTYVRDLELASLDENDRELRRRFASLLKECVANGLGLYVTF
jgi:hypothetical protein